jgi:hypothetical protein
VDRAGDLTLGFKHQLSNKCYEIKLRWSQTPVRFYQKNEQSGPSSDSHR